MNMTAKIKVLVLLFTSVCGVYLLRNIIMPPDNKYTEMGIGMPPDNKYTGMGISMPPDNKYTTMGISMPPAIKYIGRSRPCPPSKADIERASTKSWRDVKFDILCRSSSNEWNRCGQVCAKTGKFRLAQLYTRYVCMPMYIHDLKTDPYVSGAILNSGVFEGSLVNIMWNQLRKNPDAVFVDVGAQLGQYSMLAASAGHKVYAVDPIVSNLERFCDSVSLNSFTHPVTIIYGALSSNRKNVSLFNGEQNIGATQVRTGGTTPCHLLDDLLKLFRMKKVIMKMDVESHEGKVLEGGSSFFKENDVQLVMMEWYFHNKLNNASVPFILDFMKSNSMVPYDHGFTRQLDPKKVTSWGFLEVFWVKRKG